MHTPTQAAPTKRRTLYDLLSDWNAATNPSELRTDAEHAEQNARARELTAEIDARYTLGREYKQLSNGMLVPTADGVAAQEAAWCNQDRAAFLSIRILEQEAGVR